MTTRPIVSRSFLGVALKLLSVFLSFYFVREAWVERDAAVNNEAALKHEIDEKQRIAVSHDEYAAQLNVMRADLARLEKRLPSNLTSTAIKQNLRDLAVASGLDLDQLTVSAEHVEEGFYSDRRADFMVVGPTTGFVTFLNRLMHEMPERIVSSLKIEGDDQVGNVRATLHVFYFRHIDVE